MREVSLIYNYFRFYILALKSSNEKESKFSLEYKEKMEIGVNIEVWLALLVLWHINVRGIFNAESILVEGQ